jgi:hypothetical protein
MRSPLKTAGVLDKRLRIWRSMLMERYSIPLLEAEDENEKLSDLSQAHLALSYRYGMPVQIPEHAQSTLELHEIANDVVLGEVITSRGRLLDLLEFIECCWPERKAWCEQRRLRSSLATTSHDWAYALHELVTAPGSQENFLIGDLSRRLEKTVDHQGEDDNWIPELEILYAYHDAKARLRAFLEMDLSEGLKLDATLDEIAFAARDRHGTLESSKLEWLFREYIFNERLFLWGQERAPDARATRYRFIYDVANLNTASLDAATRDYLDGFVRWRALEGRDFDNVSKILHRIGLFIQCFGYEHFFEDITEAGGQWGPASGVGSGQPITLIPGKKLEICHDVVLGVASGLNTRSRRSLQNVLRAVITQLHNCETETRIVIITTDVWDPEVIKSFVPGLSLHLQQGKKFLVLLVNGRRLIPMELSVA